MKVYDINLGALLSRILSKSDTTFYGTADDDILYIQMTETYSASSPQSRKISVRVCEHIGTPPPPRTTIVLSGQKWDEPRPLSA